MKIALLSPNINCDDFRPPLSLIYLASYLRSRGVDCTIIDANDQNLSVDETLSALEATHADFVGLSFYQTTLTDTLDLCDRIKKALSNIKIVGGGPLMTTSYDRLMVLGAVDYGVLGEGEETLCELLQTDPSEIEKVSGLAFCEGTEVRLTNRRAPITNLDELPPLDYSLINIDSYFQRQVRLKIPKSLFLTTSRGCAHRCTFCSTATLWPGKVRRYSVNRIAREIAEIKQRYGDVNLSFMDDSFFASESWLHEFFDAIRPLSLTYGCIGRADHLTEEIVKKLKETGCIFVAVGVETGVQRKQKELRKNLSLERVKESIRLLARWGIYSKCYFMLGFPTETIADMAETINFAVALAIEGMSDCTIFAVNLFIGTEMSAKYDETFWRSKTYRGAHHDKLSFYSSVPDVDLNPYVPRDSLVELIKVAYRKIETRTNITPLEIEQIVQRTSLDTTSPTLAS